MAELKFKSRSVSHQGRHRENMGMCKMHVPGDDAGQLKCLSCLREPVKNSEPDMTGFGVSIGLQAVWRKQWCLGKPGGRKGSRLLHVWVFILAHSYLAVLCCLQVAVLKN